MSSICLDDSVSGQQLPVQTVSLYPDVPTRTRDAAAILSPGASDAERGRCVSGSVSDRQRSSASNRPDEGRLLPPRCQAFLNGPAYAGGRHLRRATRNLIQT